jgi:hypothetical protein
LILIEHQPITSVVTTIEFTGIPATYDAYKIIVSGVQPTTDVSKLWLRVSDDNGSTFKTTSYQSAVFGRVWNSTSFIVDINITDRIDLTATGSQGGTGTNENISAVLEVGELGLSAPDKVFSGRSRVQSHLNRATFIDILGNYNSAIAIDALQFLWDSGNFAAKGSITLYGYSKG